MKKFIHSLVIGVLLLSGFGAIALQNLDIKPIFETIDYEEPLSTLSPRDYTHTVLVEVGTASWCPACPVPSDGENNPPSAPEIDGPTSGKVGIKYDYILRSTDPDGDNVSYCIQWGDNTEMCIGPFASGENVTANHTWFKRGVFTIKAQAKDTHGAVSDWGTLEVTMPKNKSFNFNFNMLSWLFERFPNAFPILRHLLGL